MEKEKKNKRVKDQLNPEPFEIPIYSERISHLDVENSLNELYSDPAMVELLKQYTPQKKGHFGIYADDPAITEVNWNSPISKKKQEDDLE
jgi:hypothetical protein